MNVWEDAIRNRTATASRFTLLACLVALVSTFARAAEVSPEAVRGYDRYIQLAEQRMSRDLAPGGPFLWTDGLPEPRRSAAYAELQRGEIVAARLHTADPGGETRTPGALLLHWVGIVYIPGATMQQVLAVAEDYNRHTEYYAPEVLQSKLIVHAGSNYKVHYRLRKKKIITIILDVDYDVHRHFVDAAHAYSDALSGRIAQVEHAGEADERELPPGKDSGFLWRLNSYWRYFDSGKGVYVQCEAISLSRDIPAGLGWLIGPLVESVPKESLEFTLGSTRAAVQRSLHN